MHGIWIARAALLLALGSIACGPASSSPQEPFPRATMAEIAESLSRALPLSLTPERLEDPAQRERFGESLRTLADQASRLEAHGRSREPSFVYLSHSLARDARDARRRFEGGHDAEAQFLVRQLVYDCFACHSRLPDPEDSDLGGRLLTHLTVEDLSPAERLRIQVATRQFDVALAGYEQLFRDPDLPPAHLDLEGPLLDYLTVTIRVKQDLKRPRWTLERLAARPDVPEYLAEDLAAWTKALEELEARPSAGDALVEARVLAQDARLEQTSEFDRQGLMHALVGSSRLHQYLEASTPSPDELAEAYYLLGLTESRTSHSLWLSQASYYLETSIRSAPASPFASRAYALLEEETLAGYTGSAGLMLPSDVEEHLAELRGLIAAAQAPAAAGDDQP